MNQSGGNPERRPRMISAVRTFHRRYGDEKGFFELFMPKRVARHMFSFFFVVTTAGYALVLLNID